LAALREVHHALLRYGFDRDRSHIEHIRYFGDLICNGIKVPVYLDIVDREFISIPRIILVDRPAELPSTCAHLGPDNVLCYVAKGTSHFDIFNAGEQIIGCVSEAEKLLSRLLSGDVLEETREEFYYYWGGAPILIDLEDVKDSKSTAWHVSHSGTEKQFWIISSNYDEVLQKYSRSGFTIEKKGAPAYIISASNSPMIGEESWPPKTLGQFVRWLNTYDKEAFKKLKRVLLDVHKEKQLRYLFIFINDYSWFGVSVLFNEPIKNVVRYGSSWVQHLLQGKGQSTKIIRMQPVRVDEEYVINRSLGEQKSLAGLRIALAGCGTIGGYLAKQLIQTGAGSAGGQLVLADPDILGPNNLGRHVLGVQELLSYKSDGLRDWLIHQMPHANIVSYPEDIRNIPLESFDLIIDATGEEPLSEALNLRYTKGGLPPVIYTWVMGAGTAAQCLLVDSKSFGCYRCLRSTDGLEKFTPVLEDIDPLVMGKGCDDYYVPFSSSASMQAASLAGQMALGWVNDSASPRFRTRIVDYKNAKNVKDQNLVRNSRCPACSR